MIIPTHNRAKLLGRAIDSVLAQTVTDFEFIIIVDYSTDDSIDIVQEYRDPRIRHIKNHQHLGLTVSLNRGLDLARREYIA
ncbi:MAG: glycosyltransferase family 2 protein, partial [Planctomycetes bacterium]|nr:glycosyltransferase family 2 protein [Planctomycetota bacterium]